MLLDPGYATLPRMLEHLSASEVDAVLVSHGHPDHCADLNPLLRARALGERRLPPLPVYAPPRALDAVLALDPPRMYSGAYQMHALDSGTVREVGPFRVETYRLPHFVPNLGFRVTAGDVTLAYTGDTGPSPDIARLAAGADVFLAEATYVDRVPHADARYLSSARQAAEQAVSAGVGRLVLTHLWPGTNAAAAVETAGRIFSGRVAVATPDLTVDLGPNDDGGRC